jgi:hypothetical protein
VVPGATSRAKTFGTLEQQRTMAATSRRVVTIRSS